MLNIEHARPTAKKILSHVEYFEKYCLGEWDCPPSKFRQINEELSIGTVLLLGRYRYQREKDGTRLFWTGLDLREHDMGLVNDAKIMRDFPGFHAKRTNALGNHLVARSETIRTKNKKTMCMITMTDGTTAVGLDYRMALRNAALKMQLTAKFNHYSLSSIWNRIWGHA